MSGENNPSYIHDESSSNIGSPYGVSSFRPNKNTDPPPGYVNEAYAHIKPDNDGINNRYYDSKNGPQYSEPSIVTNQHPGNVHGDAAVTNRLSGYGQLTFGMNNQSGVPSTMPSYDVSPKNGDMPNRAQVYSVSPTVSQIDRVDGPQKEVGGRDKKPVICSILVVIAVILLLAGAAVCVYIFVFKPETKPIVTAAPVEESNTFAGKLTLSDTWSDDLNDKQSKTYINVSKGVEKELYIVLQESNLSSTTTVEVTHMRKGSIVVFFRLIFSVFYTSNTVLDVLQNGFTERKDNGKANIDITDPSSDIELEAVITTTISGTSTTPTTPSQGPTTSQGGNIVETTESTIVSTTTSSTVGSSTKAGSTLPWIYKPPVRTTPAAVRCELLENPVCSDVLGYNAIGFPNVFEDETQLTAGFKLRLFQDLHKKECYKYTMEFACASLYPQCEDRKLILPCRRFCYEFSKGCSYPIACEEFPDDDDPAMCRRSPAYDGNVLTTAGPSVDPCGTEDFRCGNDHCVSQSARCDGQNDCQDYTDEIGCGETMSPLDCTFEDNSMCNYAHDPNGHFSWTLSSGSTDTSGTGPVYDHTLRTVHGHYLLAEASGRYWLDVARTRSGLVTNASPQCLRFYYHMYGSAVESLEVIARETDGTETVLWIRSKQHGNYWRFGDVTLPVGTYFVILQATRGRSHLGDIAVDDMTSRAGECPHRGCPEGEFLCDNGNCLQQEYVCNRKDDCGDFSDEQQDCECTNDEWKCNMGLCIDRHNRCDKEHHCPDTSDELDCDCPMGQHMCHDGQCILSEWLCDRDVDCAGGEDERNCSTCQPDEYQCHDYGCVGNTRVCDGVNDCVDGSDETSCVTRTEQDLIVKVRQGEKFLPICAQGFPRELGDTVCRALGEDYVILQTTDILQTNAYVTWDDTTPADGSLLLGLKTSPTCLDSNVVVIECGSKICGTRNDDMPLEYIVGGTAAAPGRWPWQVGIKLNGVFTCGGSLISPHHILTAAHCTGTGDVPFPATNFQIILGTTKRTQPTENRIERAVKKIIIPTGYDRDLYFWGNDIAIMAMAEPVNYTDYVRPVCLPRPDEVFPLTSLCFVSGWGYTDYENQVVPELLQEGKMKLWSNTKCHKSYDYATDSMICAGYNSGFISNCPGDSGGPLVCQDYRRRWMQVGVFSFMSIGCNIPMKPPVFTKVQDFRSWIDDNLDCAFVCDNGRCLVSATDICDGIDDCNDMSDETRTCNPSVTCDFEDKYMCGYAAIRYDPHQANSYWARKQSARAHNQGPVVDWNIGHVEGFYMYSGKPQAVLLAPLYKKNASHCLKFHYHMRSRDAGQLKVFRADAPEHIVFAQDADISNRVTMFNEQGHLGDLWHFGSIDISPGSFVIGFEGIGVGEKYPAVAIDDVSLAEGFCAQHVCADGMFRCVQNGLCIPEEHRCNIHVQCIDESDEVGCSTRSHYFCDVEHYGLCGLDQNTFEDTRDWQVSRPQYNYGYFNGPSHDNTLKTSKGHFLLLDTKTGRIGDRAQISLPVKTMETAGCLKFHLNMISSGAISVTFFDDSHDFDLAWKEMKVNTNASWVLKQIDVPVGVRLVVIDGILGGDRLETTHSYIALDDIEITDELCMQPTCRPNQFTCKNGECLYKDYVCDHFLDCSDGSDEAEDLCVCKEDTFRCANGECLAGHVRCNGIDNCADGSDELSCQTCYPNEYQCDDGTCKPYFTWCDGQVDCDDGSDEGYDCECWESQFRCADDRCIVGTRYCDGIIDCLDGSDEDLNCTCDTRWQFQCDNGRCIPKDYECDFQNQCGDYSDEKNCECIGDQFKCNNGQCLDSAFFCNGKPDCLRGEDEYEGCECGEGRFACDGGGCIFESDRCDGIVQCQDQSDETGCEECYDGEFQCDDGRCIPDGYACNGVTNCLDMSDEIHCVCSVDQWRCANKICISAEHRCNGHDECGDESDEQGCGCRAGEYKCQDSKCIQSEWLCDGKRDCNSGEDELNCGSCDPGIAFQCADYSCVSRTSRCDDHVQCPDGSDEHGCVSISLDAGDYGLVKSWSETEMVPICSDNWPENWSDSICKGIGQGNEIGTSSIKVQDEKFLSVVEGATGNFSYSKLVASSECQNGEALKIICKHRECGLQYNTSPVPSSPSTFVVGGELAAENEWPWMVGIYYLGRYRCGGVLIDNQWILSAAHCFFWSNNHTVQYLPHHFWIEMGSTKISSPTAIKHYVQRIILHPNYRSVQLGLDQNDLALIQLLNPVEHPDDRHRPLCLPAEEESFPPTQCYVAGWGYTYRNNEYPANDLREAKMQLVSGSRCSSEVMWGSQLNNETQLCAGYDSGYITTCFGDSGSPLMCSDWTGRWSLYGITSLGDASCGLRAGQTPDVPAKPNVFAKVDAYIDWISSTMEQNKR